MKRIASFFLFLLVGNIWWANSVIMANNLADYSLEEVITQSDKDRVLKSSMEVVLPEFYRAFQKPHWDEYFTGTNCADHLGQPLAQNLLLLFKNYIEQYPESLPVIINNLENFSEAQLIPVLTVLTFSRKKVFGLAEKLPEYFDRSPLIRLRALELFLLQEPPSNRVRKILRQEWEKEMIKIKQSGGFSGPLDIQVFKIIFWGMLVHNDSFAWKECEKFLSDEERIKKVATIQTLELMTGNKRAISLLQKYIKREKDAEIRAQFESSLRIIRREKKR